MTETATLEDKTKAPSLQRGDGAIWGIYITLLIISVIETYSASSQEISKASNIYVPILKHIFMLILGFGSLLVIQRTHFKKFGVFIVLFSIFTVVMMIVVMFKGDLINGARRTITIAGMSIQPPEMAKLAIVALIAWVMSRTQKVKGVKGTGVVICAIAVLVFSALLFQSGFTNTALLMGISLAMMLIGGIEWRKFLYVIIVYAAFAGVYKLIDNANSEKVALAKTEQQASVTGSKTGVDRSSTRSNRISRYMNADSLIYQPINSINQQEMYSRFAQAHGGVFGVGPGRSRECSRLPLAFSDYIFSIVVEEGGAVGGLFLLFLYLALLARAGIIASRCTRAFPALLILGMAVMITLQALAHIAINTGLAPVSGQPLPLISKGGTSILMTSVAFGVMLSVSRFADRSNKTKGKEDVSTLPESMRAANPSQIK